ncbi:MAG: heparinase II/III family protein [Myxococcota bacterium]
MPRRTAAVDATHFELLGESVPHTPTVDWKPSAHPSGTLGRIVLHEHRWIEPLADDDVQRILESWCQQVHAYEGKDWIDAYNAFALSVRVVVWMQQLADRPALSDGCRRTLQDSLVAQLAFLHRNLETDLGGNHLIKDIKALLWGAACFEGADPTRWHTTAVDLLQRELIEQVPPDGLHAELSPAYHLQVFADLVEIYSVLDPSPIRAQLMDALNRMATAARLTTAPDGAPILLNDAGLTMAYPCEAICDAWARLGGSVDANFGPFALRNSGLFGFRSAQDLVVLDAGPLGMDALPGHGHADALNLLWSLGGHRVFVDPGVYEYQGPSRPWCRSTEAHNTVCIDGEDQAELFSVFRAGRRWTATVHEWSPTDDGFRVSASHDGYRRMKGSPVHRRTVHLHRDVLRIVDEIANPAEHRIESGLLLHPDIQVKATEDGATLTTPTHSISLTSSLRTDVKPAIWCPDFGVKTPTLRLYFDFGVGVHTHSLNLSWTKRDR